MNDRSNALEAAFAGAWAWLSRAHPRHIAIETIAACPFSVAHEYAVEYLRRAEAGGREAAIRVPAGIGSAAPSRMVAFSFGLHFDVAEAGRAHDEIRLRWNARSPLFPNFRGVIRFRIEGPHTRIEIDGGYDAPFGAAGAAFDDLFGRWIARVSLRDLTTRLARHLEQRERDWRSESTVAGA